MSMRYEVLIDDNFHDQDESERVRHGDFATEEEAVSACETIVDECLTEWFKSGMTADDLFRTYLQFGDDPFVRAIRPEGPPVKFSAREYAEKRCKEIATARPQRDPSSAIKRAIEKLHRYWR